MSQRIIVFFFTLFTMSTVDLNAQENTTASGGEATGVGGTSNYSIGQVFYTSDIGNNGDVSKGVQQAFEVSVLSVTNQPGTKLKLMVYPNPTSNFLTLKLEGIQSSTFTIELTDLNGKVIMNRKVNSVSSLISTENLPKAVYLLRINDNKKLIKTFKIIKN